MNSKRVLLGMCEICNFYGNLAAGLSRNGFVPECLFLSGHLYSYEHRFRSSSLLWASIEWIHARRVNVNSFYRLFFLFIEMVMRTIFVFVSIFRYKYFVFGQGNTLLPWNLDVPIIRLIGRPVLIISHGSDFRPDSISGYRVGGDVDIESLAQQLAIFEPRRARKIRRLEKWSTYVVGHPPSTSQFLQEAHIAFYYLGIPISVEGNSAENIKSKNKKLIRRIPRLVHATSDIYAKGTLEIEKILDEISSEGIRFSYMRLENVPNKRVIEEIRAADIVLDELYSDTTMATIAVEATWLNKPVVVGVNGLDFLQRSVSPLLIPPSCYCKPEDYKKTLISLIKNSECRNQAAAKAKSFLEIHWRPEEVARKLMLILNGNAPDDWFFDPANMDSLMGLGHPASRSHEIVSTVFNRFGYKSLGFAWHPKLLAEVKLLSSQNR